MDDHTWKGAMFSVETQNGMVSISLFECPKKGGNS